MTLKETAINILTDLCNNCGFDEVIESFKRYTFEDWLGSSYDTVNISEGYITMTNGASKLAFWEPDSDVVFKMGFKNFNCDYCEIEAENFLKAREAGLEKFFAKTEYLTTFKGIKVYVSERAEVSYDLLSSDLYSHLKEEGYEDQEISQYISEIDESNEFFEQLLPYYVESSELIDNLIDFIESNDINDLHYGNIGYLGDRIVLIDYSGF